MRVTHSMLMSGSLRDLDLLRQKYYKAQNAVNGRVLERPSDDPQRVVEAMDLSGAKLRYERAQRTGQDSREWLGMAESTLDSMIDRLQGAREIAIQAGGPVALAPDAQAALARDLRGIRDDLMRELNGQYRGQYLFAGWSSDTKPFVDNAVGGVDYQGTENQILRDIAPDLPVSINVHGKELMASGDFMQTLTDMIDDLTNGNVTTVATTRLQAVDSAIDNLNKLRSDVGIRYAKIERYEAYAERAILNIEERLGNITGGNVEIAMIQMTEARSTYEAAMVAFSRTLPTSLLDFMLR